MASITPNLKKRNYLLPPGCKDLIDVLTGRRQIRRTPRINEKISAARVLFNGVTGIQSHILLEAGIQVGVVLALYDAIKLAVALGGDLVETDRRVRPPCCKITILDYGRFRYEISKRSKRLKKTLRNETAA